MFVTSLWISSQDIKIILQRSVHVQGNWREVSLKTYRGKEMKTKECDFYNLAMNLPASNVNMVFVMYVIVSVEMIPTRLWGAFFNSANIL